jgi:low affinity Fe/Cu permease
LLKHEVLFSLQGEKSCAVYWWRYNNVMFVASG